MTDLKNFELASGNQEPYERPSLRTNKQAMPATPATKPNPEAESFLSLTQGKLIIILLLVITFACSTTILILSNMPKVEEEEFYLRFRHSPYKNETLAVKERFFNQIKQSTPDFRKDPSKKLLIGVSIGPYEFQRRYLMRAYQIHPFRDLGVTFRFVMGTPDRYIEKDIKYENDTHGDLIILNNYTDSRLETRSTKPFLFFRHVEENMGPYNYVAKMDSDTFLNVPAFMREYFNTTVQNLDFGMIALFIKGYGVFDWPQGGFEALSWKAMLMLNRFYDEVPKSTLEEDIMLSYYFYDAEINITQIELNTTSSYDFREGTTWSYLTDVNYDAIRIHELKTEEDYLNVANCFTPQGINLTHVDYMRSFNWTTI